MRKSLIDLIYDSDERSSRLSPERRADINAKLLKMIDQAIAFRLLHGLDDPPESGKKPMIH